MNRTSIQAVARKTTVRKIAPDTRISVSSGNRTHLTLVKTGETLIAPSLSDSLQSIAPPILNLCVGRQTVTVVRSGVKGPRGEQGPPGNDGVGLPEIFILESPDADSPDVAYPALVLRPTGTPDQFRLELLQ